MRAAPADLFETNSVVAHRYRILAYRGDRGFGQVYEAEDSAMDRRVALMRLSREFSRPETRESFYETRSTAAVEDPRIVDLCDYGEDLDGRLFLVMPWVPDAEGLDERLAREGAPSWPRVRAIIEQMAGALAAAHAKGVLHGGLEPRRVLIDGDDGVHIVDFGLAPALTQTPKPAAGAREITISGPLPGKIEYLSPEQVRGEAVDERSDIYALGVILWELLAGAPPFVGEPVAVADAHLAASLPALPRRTPPLDPAPAELEPLLQLALAKQPDDRLASADEFLRLLAAIPERAQPTIARVATSPLVQPTPAAPPPPPSAAPSAEPPRPAAVEPPRPAAVEPAAAEPAPAEPAPAEPAQPAAVEPAPTRPVAAPHTLTPEPESPAPPPRKRRLGKLELAVLVFLGFDVLLFAGWKLFGSSQGGEQAIADAAEPEPPSKPAATPEPAPPEQPDAEPDPSEAEAEAPDPDADPIASVHEAIAAELPPEPEVPGPVRPMAKTLTEKAFREAVVAARDENLERCLDGHMRRTLEIAVKVAASGKVDYARVVGSQAETSLGQCIAKQLYRIEFPATYEGGTHTYKLRLR